MKKFIGNFMGDDVYLDDVEDAAAIALIEDLSEQLNISLDYDPPVDGVSVREAQRLHNYMESGALKTIPIGKNKLIPQNKSTYEEMARDMNEKHGFGKGGEE